MRTCFVLYGPFSIAFDGGSKKHPKFIERKQEKTFWTQAGASTLREKRGCYVFALRASRGFVPWYVGKTNKGFAKECFTPAKLNIYNSVMHQRLRGTPVLFFVAPRGNRTVVSKEIVHEVEIYLIQTAARRNPGLKNVHHAKKPTWLIQGAVYSNRGKPPETAQKFKTMMALD